MAAGQLESCSMGAAAIRILLGSFPVFGSLSQSFLVFGSRSSALGNASQCCTARLKQRTAMGRS